jgi:methyl-accepting chemotaxis protein
MRLTVGRKIGGGFVLVTLMLLLAGGVGLNGAVRLSGAVDYFANQAWSSVEGASGFTSSIQKQATILAKVTGGVAPLNNEESTALELADKNTKASIEQLVNAGIASEDQIIKINDLYDKYIVFQNSLIQQHSVFSNKREAAFNDYLEFSEFMKVVEFYVNNIYALPNVETSEKFELVTYFFKTKLALQTRFYYMQRFLGGDNQVEMLDELEGAWEDLTDESEELADLELTDVEIRTGEFAGNTYATLLIERIESHKIKFHELAQSYKQYQKTKLDYEFIKASTLKNVSSFVAQLGRTIDLEAEQSSKIKTQVYTMTIIAIIAGVIIAIVARVFCAITVVRPIAEAGKRMRDISSGDGDLTLTLPVNGRDEIAFLGKNFNKFVEKIRTIISKTIEISEQLSVTSEKLQGLAQKTSEATSSQKDGSKQIATALCEMTASFQEVAENASNAEILTTQANDCVDSSKDSVTKNRSSIEGLSSSIVNASNVIQQLAEESVSVGSILNVIRGIAEQTNLLALNAAIEAARAGEQGRGFAVVADEVRTLAQRTQESTGEIQKLIEGLHTKSNEAVSVIENSKENALESVEFANEVSVKLESVGNSVTQVFEMNVLIAAAAEEQAYVAEDINRNVTNINDLSEITSNDANSALTESKKLFRLAEEIQEIVHQFKV